MIFEPQTYVIDDTIGVPFIDPDEIRTILRVIPSEQDIYNVIQESRNKKRLSLQQTAILLNAPKELRQKVMDIAKDLKQSIYGNRIVLFAPLYVGNKCMNKCTYCSFRSDNNLIKRKTLTENEILSEIEALLSVGHKRLILVFSEHQAYDSDFIANTINLAYSVVHKGNKIKKINVNAAPLKIEGFKRIKQERIGAFQVFQETYNPYTYKRYHISGAKADYSWRLTAMDRAMSAGIDDVGLGILLGLGDWKFDILGLIRHVNHLEACFNIGPHTLSLPRVTYAEGATEASNPVGDEDLIYAVAVLRLAVPYAGIILTARESARIREESMKYGVSQIDGGTKLEIGSYANMNEEEMGAKQFAIHDNRTLSEVVDSLIKQGGIPSFCTSCYMKNRTGEHFMELSTSGFIKTFCTPNAITTFAEYLENFASDELKIKGYELIDKELVNINNAYDIREKITLIKNGVEAPLL